MYFRRSRGSVAIGVVRASHGGPAVGRLAAGGALLSEPPQRSAPVISFLVTFMIPRFGMRPRISVSGPALPAGPVARARVRPTLVALLASM
ncbi:MAG TPA: hypothetical protein VN324_14270, partial [Quisquiliibacterium sp.]|nr:hypothetical protein [Quisquiliibacterium sp.]